MSSRNRSWQLLRTVGSTALRAGMEKILPVNKTAANRLTQGLDELKGAAMKMGQMLSMLDEQLVPEQWKVALTKLQSQATAQPFEKIEPLLKQNIENLHAKFQHIEPQAIHAASIGQVHIGYLKDGTKVAIKVRYPNLHEWVSKDLNSLKTLLKVTGVLPDSNNYEDVFKTVQQVFLQELNFTAEAEYYSLYGRHFSNQRSIKVPQVFKEFSNEQVLVTQWMEGISLTQWLASNPTSKEKENIAQLLLELLFNELFDLKLMQTDPNPANFLVTTEGQLILLDFGATTPLRHELVEQYKNLTMASLQGSKDDVLKTCYEMSFLKENDSQKAKDYFVAMLAIATEPFQHNTFHFGANNLTQRLNKIALGFSTETKLRAPPGEIVFLNRRIAGTQIMLEKIAAELEAKKVLMRHILPNSK